MLETTNKKHPPLEKGETIPHLGQLCSSTPRVCSLHLSVGAARAFSAAKVNRDRQAHQRLDEVAAVLGGVGAERGGGGGCSGEGVAVAAAGYNTGKRSS